MSYPKSFNDMPDKIENIDNGDTILVFVSGNQIYIEMVKNALEEEGIPVLLKSPTGFHLRGMVPLQQEFFDFRLYVAKEHSGRASEIIRMIVPCGEE